MTAGADERRARCGAVRRGAAANPTDCDFLQSPRDPDPTRPPPNHPYATAPLTNVPEIHESTGAMRISDARTRRISEGFVTAGADEGRAGCGAVRRGCEPHRLRLPHPIRHSGPTGCASPSHPGIPAPPVHHPTGLIPQPLTNAQEIHESTGAMRISGTRNRRISAGFVTGGQKRHEAVGRDNRHEPGRPGPGKPRPGKPGPRRPRPGKPGPGRPRPGKPGPGRPRAQHARTKRPGPGKPRPGRPGPGRPGPQPGPCPAPSRRRGRPPGRPGWRGGRA